MKTQQPIILKHAGVLEDGTIRLQSQLYVGRITADFVLKDGKLYNWGAGPKGFDFYETIIKYKII